MENVRLTEDNGTTRVTLREIADRVGLSTFAVSRALTGKSGVSDDTRRRVMAAAESLGYVSRLPKAAPRSVDVFFRDRSVADREMWIDVQHGIDAEASRLGLHMAVRWTDDPQVVARGAAESAGIILVGPQSDEVYEVARGLPVPAIVVGQVLSPLMPIDQINILNVEAGAAVARFLHDLGHRRMVYVHGQLGYAGRIGRHRGFAEELALRSDASLREMAFETDYTARGFREEFLALCDGGFTPTAIFCGNDGVAVTVVSELHRMGLRVPLDISVVGVGDYPIATQIAPALTTVHMPHRQMGVAAVRQLARRSSAFGEVDDLPPVRISLVPHLLERDSTAVAAGRDWRVDVVRSVGGRG